MNSDRLVKYIIMKGDYLDPEIFLKYIRKYRLEMLMVEVLKKLKQRQEKDDESLIVKVLSPHKLSQDNLKSLSEKFNINLDSKNNKIDKSIITGYKVYTKDRIIDASLDTLLKNFINK